MMEHARSLMAAATLLAASTVFIPQGAQAEAISPQTDKQAVAAANKAKVEAVLQAWMAGDGAALQPLLSDDIEWTITGYSVAAGTTRGREELMEKVLRPFGARFSQSNDRFRPRKILGVFADGDTVVANFDGAGIANSGLSYRNSYVWLLSMKDGKVVRATAFFDSIAFNELWDKVQPAMN